MPSTDQQLPLTDQQLYLFLAQLAFGAVLVIAAAVAARGNLPAILDHRHGKFLLQIITIFFVCTITGNLTLMKLLNPSTASALFGAVLGYVFSAGLPAKRDRQPQPVPPHSSAHHK
jgi:hypothetical protein